MFKIVIFLSLYITWEIQCYFWMLNVFFFFFEILDVKC